MEKELLLHDEPCERLMAITRKRMEGIESGKVKGKSEKELDDYLRKRGVKIDPVGHSRA
ncbi:MAG: hypothetical protein ACE5FT_05255 [Candidatus Nanoarchaeia archaeon]